VARIRPLADIVHFEYALTYTVLTYSLLSDCYFLLLHFAVTAAEMRMSYFVAGLTNDNPEVTVPVYKRYRYAQYNGNLPSSATGSVTFPPTNDTFRYVIIQQQFHHRNQAICTKEVKVFLRGNL